jgi:hypothetical protein
MRYGCEADAGNNEGFRRLMEFGAVWVMALEGEAFYLRG